MYKTNEPPQVVSSRRINQDSIAVSPIRSNDIQHQLERLNVNSEELGKTLAELVNRIGPILSPVNLVKECCDECKEEQISPLASEIRRTNNVLISMKTGIVETLCRIQL